MGTKKNLLISFSGGETSAYMAKWLIDNKADEYEMVFVFANTGQENEETLIFADQCDKAFGLNLVWVEAVVHHGERKASTYKVVSFETASRNGEPFEEVIKKYGIPNPAFPHCTREMKENPIKAYADDHFGKGNYEMVIGIRIDEIDRMSATAKKRRLIYPLISMRPTTKPEINAFWLAQPFRLMLKGWQGNCKACWKKSLRKLCQIAKEAPEKFDWMAEMERKYANHSAGREMIRAPFRFFRKNRTVQDIIELSKQPFRPPVDDSELYEFTRQLGLFDDEWDKGGGCGESCEVFTDDS